MTFLKEADAVNWNFQNCMGSSVEFLELDKEGAEWETMPNLLNQRPLYPKVTIHQNGQ